MATGNHRRVAQSADRELTIVADAETHVEHVHRTKQSDGEWAWWREELNHITGETRWAVRLRRLVVTGYDPDGGEIGIPGGFGELVETYGTMNEAIARVEEIDIEMSWRPA